MRHGKSEGADRYIARGRRALAAGSLFGALDLFRKAVDCTAPSDRIRLYRALYWLSLSALRLGRRDLAVKALKSASGLERRGHARSLYERLSNGYGMPRQACADDDDRLAFFSIHLARYLGASRRKAFSGPPERDMVLDLIHDGWKDLLSSGILADRSCAEKQELFRRARISFPWADPGFARIDPGIIRVDFRRGSRMAVSDRCSCGSGLPFGRCCGAPLGYIELGTGTF